MDKTGNRFIIEELTKWFEGKFSSLQENTENVLNLFSFNDKESQKNQ